MTDYFGEMQLFISRLSHSTPSVLLHSCCAVCSGHVIEVLAHSFNVDVFYFNPNIWPKSEYQKRKSEQQRLIRETTYSHDVRYIDCDYDYPLFLSAVSGLENDREGGERCARCYALRLQSAACYAAQQGRYSCVATTLSVSPHKNARVINEIGLRACAQYGVTWLPSDFKKRGGFQRANEIAREKGLYRQQYCGCQFSLRETS